jgi:3-oxoacyl-[acyl-carrier-protein] synthase-3
VSASPDSTAIATWLRERLAGELGIRPEQVELERSPESYGIDSVVGVQICADLGDWLIGRELPADTLLAAPSLQALCEQLAAGNFEIERAAPVPLVTETPPIVPARMTLESPQRSPDRGLAAAVGIAGIEYVLPSRRASLEELEKEGKISSDRHALAQMGFGGALLSEVPANRLALEACTKLLEKTGIDRERVGLLVNACAIPISALARGDHDWGGEWGGKGAELKLLTYSSCRLQHELGLVNARAIGVGEMASMCLLGAVRTTQAMMLLDNIDYAICVEADVFPAVCARELVYNVVSDGACAVLLQRNAERNQIIGYSQITKGYYWDPLAQQNEMVSAYFVTARRAIEAGLQNAGLTLDDVDLLVPANISRKSWSVLAGMLHFPIERVYLDSITRQAHSVGADNYINFKDLLDAGRLQPGNIVMMYSFGVGAHWACQLIRV